MEEEQGQGGGPLTVKPVCGHPLEPNKLAALIMSLHLLNFYGVTYGAYKKMATSEKWPCFTALERYCTA